MSLRIIKAGILDTIQDNGRYGYQHLGVNPGGAMDNYAAKLSNALIGEPLHASVIEMHFPASTILFEEAAIICLTGADFTPMIKSEKIHIGQPLAIEKGSVLEFKTIQAGARCYLSLLNGMVSDNWLDSYSTNLKIGSGGFKGRALKTGDEISFTKAIHNIKFLKGIAYNFLPWGLQHKRNEDNSVIRIIKGNEWNDLDEDGSFNFQNNSFRISNTSDRMGFRLIGEKLKVKHKSSMISSGVTFGTIQLLPDGQLIVLMADHQTTGGYPRIGHVISADLSIIAQKRPGEKIYFQHVDLKTAEQKLILQNQYLHELQAACKVKMQKII